MKFWGIFRFELTYQIRRAWPWLIFVVLFVVDFLMTRDGSLAEALYEDFFVNSPFAIVKTTVFGSLIWLLAAAAVAGEAASRDVATGMHPLTFTTSASKAEYLGGRFLAALVLNAWILLAVPLGILAAVYSPGVDARMIGPFRPAAYLTAYAFIALPNAFVATAIQFALATRTGRAMAGYAGSLMLIFMGFFVASILLFKRELGALLDPIGIRFVVEDLSRSWTTVEKSQRLLAFDGAVLRNRALWMAVALGTLIITYVRFRFGHPVESSWWNRRARRAAANTSARAETVNPARTPIIVPEVARRFGAALHARQTLAVAWDSFRTMVKSWTGIALLAGVPLLTVAVVIDQMVDTGVALIPATPRVLMELTAPMSAELSRWVIIPLLIIFFAGELVWREREASLGEIVDATPIPEWVPLLGKLLGLGLLLALFMALLTASGMLAQVILGYRNFEIGLYARVMFGLQLPEYLLFAVLALVVHALVNQKYIAHLVAILCYVFIILASLFGVEHDLFIYGAGPGWSYSEMRGFGASLGPWAWFKLYWAAWAVLLAVAARLLWVRGRENGLRARLALARRRVTRPTMWTAGIAGMMILGVGAFIFYNTNVLNEYLDSSDIAERRAEYERRYARYAGEPQPELVSTSLRVEIHPERRSAEIHGSYQLVNRSTVPIDSVHVATRPGAAPRTMTFNRAASLLVADRDRGTRIYALTRPLEPGDSLRLDFDVRIEPHGFRESGVDESVTANGTYFTNGDWLPAIGYQRNRELTSAADRRKYGLAARSLIPSLYDADARKERRGGTAFEAVVGTDADQIAVAPGALRQTWIENGRRYFRYATDAPIGNEWTFASARYAVREARWKNVTIRIAHDPRHTRNLDRMVRSIQASMEYYSGHFGPYQYAHLTVVEHPGSGIGLHADPGMLTYAEGVSLWNPKDGPDRLDFPYAVVAHEMGHQWTIPYANVEGAPVMSESIAWYGAMEVVKDARGIEEQRRLLGFMRQPYPYAPIRRGEPLLRGLDPYMSYRRGPFALYALSEYLGEGSVNTALRRLLEKHRPDGAPLATTLDLYNELRAVTPDSLRYLLHDLFEVNTYWQLETRQATAEQLRDSSWQVTLKVRARKTSYDSAGVETELPMNESVDIGIFAAVPTGDDELSKPLHVQKLRIHSGEQTITVIVPRQPSLAGIDPYHVLDWEVKGDDDNVEAVKVNR